MPVQNIDQRLAEWMSSPPSTGRLVEGVFIGGNAYVGARRYARGIYEAAALPDEWGVAKTWAPANFDLDLPERGDSLNQELVITFDGLRPDTVRAYDRIPPEVLYTVSFVRLYSWLIPGGDDAPLITPPPRFAIVEVKLSASKLELTCSGPILPRKRAGRVYTVEDFPGLSVE